ncbi:hypothetical protein RSAG8_01756, partial [Rhizoctonia solani AG-8 WAC10335]
MIVICAPCFRRFNPIGRHVEIGGRCAAQRFACLKVGSCWSAPKSYLNKSYLNKNKLILTADRTGEPAGG